MYNGIKLVSGQNCIPDSAYSEFMTTKNQYGKANGVFFKQYVQSFKPNTATPEIIHQIGIETAKYFDGFEVVVATHIDRDHWHNHFVVNSVNCETGLKIQINEKGLEELRNYSDKICQQFGIETLKPYVKPKEKSPSHREYRAALKGESWKFALMAMIDRAMKHCRTIDEFKKYMKQYGYDVKWQDNYKYITYTCPNSMKCRDIRLHEEKYRKENMELEFRLRGAQTKERYEYQQAAASTKYNDNRQRIVADADRTEQESSRDAGGFSRQEYNGKSITVDNQRNKERASISEKQLDDRDFFLFADNTNAPTYRKSGLYICLRARKICCCIQSLVCLLRWSNLSLSLQTCLPCSLRLTPLNYGIVASF